MADLWFYARGAELFGPFSGWPVDEWADAGAVLRTDTVWKDGSEYGVPADQIPHLFPAAPAATPAAPSPAVGPAYPPYQARPGVGQRRAIAGQDGTVRFTKRCVTCGQQDRCTSTATIVAGTMRFSFFCPKCRRRQPVEIQGR